jgi:hypothetical protein
VLVAEDNPDLRLFLYDVLIDEYNVSLEDGESAWPPRWPTRRT